MISVAEPPTVQVVRAETRDIVRVVGQPSFVEAYERTSIYPKLAGFIQRWYVDIGDRVHKDQVIADLFVPEIVEEWQTKGATVEYDKKRVTYAEQVVLVAAADVKVAEAKLKSAKATWHEFKAEVERWESEVGRLQGEVDRGVVGPQTLLEAQNQLRGCIASREAADAEVAKAEADVQSKKAALVEAQVAVQVAEANVEVADSDYKRLGAWADPGAKPYIKLFAPFDGVVVARNANTWDFVLPAAGDPSADQNAPYLSPSGEAAPIYVIDRTDVVRIFIDVPELSANYVKVGTKANVLIKAFRDQPLRGTVTRTSWAINVKSRTLRAEVDLPNPGSAIPNDVPRVVRDALTHVKLPDTDSQILPGMYPYCKVIVERPQVRALPTTALMRVGDKTFCFCYEGGKAVRTEIQTGLPDTKNKWVEVINHRRAAPADRGTQPIKAARPWKPPAGQAAAHLDDSDWLPFDGSEQVVTGDLLILSDGEPVRLATPSTDDAKVADADMRRSQAAPQPAWENRLSVVGTQIAD